VVSEISGFSGEYRFLSNFYPAAIIYLDAVYPTAEHAASPGAAKRLGRTVVLRHDWERVRKQVMLEVVLAKFGQHNLQPGCCAAPGPPA
jgi:predicted NAD-dependent protein-ADP-ribosyltransferase YbiA (DUF1768 family)